MTSTQGQGHRKWQKKSMVPISMVAGAKKFISKVCAQCPALKFLSRQMVDRPAGHE